MNILEYLYQLDKQKQFLNKIINQREWIIFNKSVLPERFISAAIFCIRVSSKAVSNKHTAAGLPVNGVCVNESTRTIFMF